MNNFFTLAIKNPKTSLNGVLTFLMVTGAYLAGYAVLHQTPFWVKVGAASSFISGLAKVYVSLISKDSGTEQAILPGQSDPQAVPSHEVPDVKGAKVVAKN